MCVTQAVYYVVNGSTPQAPCLAHAIDINSTIEIEADVYFYSNEAGQQVWGYIIVKYPDGHTTGFYANNGNPVSIGSPGLYTFIVSNFVNKNMSGTYTIQSITIMNYAKTVTLCYGTIPVGTYGCYQIDIQRPPPVFAGIWLSPPSASIQARQTATISATCKDQYGSSITCPALSWGSDNTSVATVSNGVVTGVSAGKAYIWAYVGNIVSDNRVLVTVTSACQPPGGIQRYCGTDNKTLYVWNTVTCAYDSQICSTGYCQNGYCTTPSQYHNECISNVCTQVPGAGTNQCSTINQSCTPPVTGCQNCNLTTNYCIANTCIPKEYVTYGAVGLGLLMILKMLK